MRVCWGCTGETEHIPVVLIEICLCECAGRATLTHWFVIFISFTHDYLHVDQHTHTYTHAQCLIFHTSNPGGKVLLNRDCGMSPLTQASPSHMSVIICMCGPNGEREGYMILFIYPHETRVNRGEYRKWHQLSDLWVFWLDVFDICTQPKKEELLSLVNGYIFISSSPLH